MRFALLGLSLFFLSTSGCSEAGPELPVNGIVYMDDQPLDGAAVTFFPEDASGSLGGMGKTGSDGKFVVLGSDGQDGLAPGRYKVTVNKMEGGATDEPVLAAPTAAEIKAMSQSQLPAIYSDPARTELAYSVTGDGQPIEIRLKSAPAKQ